MTSPLTRSHTEIFRSSSKLGDDDESSPPGESSRGGSGVSMASRTPSLFGASVLVDVGPTVVEPLTQSPTVVEPLQQSLTVFIPEDVSKILSLGAKEVNQEVSFVGERRTIYVRAKIGQNGKYFLGDFACQLTLYYGEFSINDTRVHGYFYIETNPDHGVENIRMKNVIIEKTGAAKIGYSNFLGIVVLNSAEDIRNFFDREINDRAVNFACNWIKKPIESIIAEIGSKKAENTPGFGERLKKFLSDI